MTNDLADFGRQFDRKCAPVWQSKSIGRILIPKNMELSGKGIGNTSVKGYAYTSNADAITDYDIRQDIEDSVNTTPQTILIPIQQDIVEIKRRDFEAMKFDGINVDSDVAQVMAVKVTKELDSTIVQGWKPDGTNYKVKGFYQIAGNSSAGSDFGSYGGALDSVAAALEALNDDAVYSDAGYNLVVAPTQYYQLLKSKSTNGDLELPRVVEMLNIGASGTPGQVMVSKDLSAATGFVSPTATPGNSIYFDLIEAQQPTNLLKYKNGDDREGDIIITQRGAAVPRFKGLNGSGLCPAVHKFTAI